MERNLSFEDISSTDHVPAQKKNNEMFLSQMSNKPQKQQNQGGLLSSIFGGKGKEDMYDEDEQMATRVQEMEFAKYGGGNGD